MPGPPSEPGRERSDRCGDFSLRNRTGQSRRTPVLPEPVARAPRGGHAALSFARNRATSAVDSTGARAPPGWPGSDGGVNPVTIAAMSLPYDPHPPEVLADPYPVLHHLQDEDPVHWSEILGGCGPTGCDHLTAAGRAPR